MANAPDTARTTVLVRDISRQVDRDQIRTIFEQYGIVTSLEVTDLAPNRLLTAVIAFATHEQAQSVIRECNYMKVNGVPIHVSWRDNDHPTDPGAKIVIKNLPPTVEEAALHDALTEYGAVDSVRITRRATGESTGVASVQFEKVESARAAHDALQRASIQGNVIDVDYYRPPSERQELPRKLPAGFVAVEGQFGGALQRDSLLALFSQFGEIYDIFDLTECAVVSFAKPESATAALDLHEAGLTVLPALRSSVQKKLLAEIERRRVYVCDITEDARAGLPALLATVGRVVQLSFVARVNDLSAIVQFASPDGRSRALAELDGRTPPGQATPMHVVPFLDKRLEHVPGGLLQVNELDPCTPAQLRAAYASFGAVSAVAVAPASDFIFGFVLFERFGDAQRAHEARVTPNSFLYPALEDAVLCDFASSFCDKTRARWLAVYDIGGRAEVLAAVGGSADSAWVAPSGVGYANFRDRADLLAAARRLHAAQRPFDVLSSYLLLRGRQFLEAGTRGFPAGRLLFVSGLPREFGNRELREVFERIGRVEAANVSVQVDSGVPNGKALVLFEDPAHAQAAKQAGHLLGEIGAQLTITDFRGKIERGSPPAPPEPQEAPQAVIPHARDRLRTALRGLPGVTPERAARLDAAVARLALDDVYTLIQDGARLEQWASRLP